MSLKVVLCCAAIFFIVQVVTLSYARPDGAATPEPSTEENFKKLYDKALVDIQNAFKNIQQSPLASNLTKIFNDLGDTISQQANQLTSNLNANNKN